MAVFGELKWKWWDSIKNLENNDMFIPAIGSCGGFLCSTMVFEIYWTPNLTQVFYCLFFLRQMQPCGGILFELNSSLGFFEDYILAIIS